METAQVPEHRSQCHQQDRLEQFLSANPTQLNSFFWLRERTAYYVSLFLFLLLIWVKKKKKLCSNFSLQMSNFSSYLDILKITVSKQNADISEKFVY